MHELSVSGTAMEGREILEVGIKGGARNLGRDDVGEIAPGFAADFVAWKTDAIGFAGGLIDPIAALIYCTPSIGWVDLSIINGDIIVQDGKLQTVDLKVRFADSQYAVILHASSSWEHASHTPSCISVSVGRMCQIQVSK